MLYLESIDKHKARFSLEKYNRIRKNIADRVEEVGTIYMMKQEINSLYVKYGEKSDNQKQSFGANIYTLLKEAFFFKNGAIGEFAKKKIYKVYEDLKSEKNQDSDGESMLNKYRLIYRNDW